MINKSIFKIFSVVAMLMMTGNVWGHVGTHYGKFVATTATGDGKVYVSLTEGEPDWNSESLPTEATWNCEGKESNDTKTGHFYAKADEGAFFVGWYQDNTLESRSASYNYELNAKATAENSATTLTLDAKFIQIYAGADFSLAMGGSWTAQNDKSTGTWNEGTEEGTEIYNGNDNAFAEGNVLTQTLDVINGFYEIQFYAFENWADWNEDANIAYGENICEAFANATKYSLVSIKSQGDRAFDEATLVTMICEVTDGKLTYGIRNIAEGGNWAVCKEKSLTYLGDTMVKATVDAAAKYGTFCAPFDVTLPEGVTAFACYDLDEYGSLEPTEYDNIIPANNAVVLHAEAGLDETFYGIANQSGETVTTGLLTGVYVATQAPMRSLVLQNHEGVIGFYTVDNVQPTVPANRCYLNEAAAGARFVGFGGETAIQSLQTETTVEGRKYVDGKNIVIVKNGKKFNVAGQRVK